MTMTGEVFVVDAMLCYDRRPHLIPRRANPTDPMAELIVKTRYI